MPLSELLPAFLLFYDIALIKVAHLVAWQSRMRKVCVTKKCFFFLLTSREIMVF